MHHQSIPIGEVGIYKYAIHMGVCANTSCVLTHYILIHVPVAMAQNDKEKGGRGGREGGRE